MRIRGLLRLLLLMMLYGGFATAGENLLPNPGFELPLAGDMPPGWAKGKHYGKLSPGSTFGLDTTGAHEGATCLKLTSVDGEIPVIVQSQPVTAQMDDKLAFSLRLKADREKTPVKMMIISKDFKHHAMKQVEVGTQWAEYTIALTVIDKGQAPDYLVRFDLLAPGTLWADSAVFTGSSASAPAAGAGNTGANTVNAADGNGNILPNPGFEDGSEGSLPTGWQKGAHYGKRADDASYVIDRQEVKGGSRSLKLISQSGEFPTIIQSGQLPATPEETYLISAYIKAEGDAPVACRLFLLSSDYKCTANANFFARNQWQLFVVTMKLNTKQTTNQIMARIDLMEKGAVWVDDVTVRRLQPGEDLSNLATAASGYRVRPTTGETKVDITVGAPTGREIPNIQGTCRSHPSFKELNLKVIRIHNILSSYNIISRDASGSLQYNWEALDKAIDATLATGAVPQMSLCFVPLEFVDNPDQKKIRKDYKPPIYLGAPNRLEEWDAYIAAVIRHCKEKYDIADWYWIFGNEPGVAQFSMGSEEEFFEIYQRAVKVAAEVYPQIRFGAASFAHQDWLNRFIDRCGQAGTRVDLISWHHYGILPEDYLTYVNRVRKRTAQYPNLKDATLAIDEWNPMLPDDGTSLSADNYGAAQQAASIKYMLDGGVAYHAFFIAYEAKRRNGMIAPDGTKNPTWNVFKMFSLLGKRELTVGVPEAEPYVGALAAADESGTVGVILWNARHISDLHRPLAKEVTLKFGAELAGTDTTAEVYMIDDTLSNGYANPARQELETSTDFTLEGGRLTLRMKSDSVALVLLKPRK